MNRYIFKYLLLFLFISITYSNLIGDVVLDKDNDQLKRILSCNCTDKTNYLDFQPVQPFNGDKTYILNWTKDFSKVRVSVETEKSNPLLVGVKIPYIGMQMSNPEFFNLTGQQDINALQHTGCSESTIQFEFIDETEHNFLFAIFGLDPSVNLRIEAWDQYDFALDLATWKTVDHGLLSVDGMNTNVVKSVSLAPSIKFIVDAHKYHGYIILKPNEDVKVAKIKLHMSNNCVPPKCEAVTLYYSLLSINCE